MRRRDLFVLAGVAALMPRTVSAQQAGHTYRLGFVAAQPLAGYAVLLEELGRLGFVEGRNLSVDPRGFGLSVEQLEATAIVTIADDVIGNRLAFSLARPEATSPASAFSRANSTASGWSC